jgi:hypothetical protein
MNVVIFSKGRPLQLKACIDSLSYYCDLSKHTVSIVSPDAKYDSELASKCETLLYWSDKEEGFDKTIRFLIDDALDDRQNLCFIVDDFVWSKPFSLSITDDYLKNNIDVFGFSLRIGFNTNFYNQAWNISKDPRFFKFEWHNKPSHWGYPFDVSCSAYRISDIKKIFAGNKNNIRLPNDLETVGVSAMLNGFGNYKFNTTMNTSSYGSCVDINRTQDLYQNRIQGGPEYSVENLKKLYDEGYRIKWENYFDIEPAEPFIGTHNLEITKE